MRDTLPNLSVVFAVIAFLLFVSAGERKGVMIYPDGYYHYFENGVHKKARADSVRLCPN